MGSPAAAALVAQMVFWALLPTGAVKGQLSPRAIGLFVGIWLLVVFSDQYRPLWLPSSSCTAIIDIALVFLVFKGDVRIT